LKLNKIIIVTVLFLVLSPIVAIYGATTPDNETFTADDYGDGLGVVAGHTIKYTINELTLPDMDNLSFSNLAGNKLYLKVLAVADHEFPGNVTGDLVYYSMGLIFTTDVTLTIGEGITAFPLVIPSGSATPGISMTGVPHFNVTEDYSPTLFFLDDGWSLTNAALSSAGFVVTEDLNILNAAASGIELEWRKSDGILTDLYIDDVVTPFGNFTGVTIDLTLDTVELKGVSLTVGQEITLQADIATLDIGVTGDISALLNETTISTIEDEINVIEGNPFITYTVDDVIGLYYLTSVEVWDFDTHSLVNTGAQHVFNAFMGNIQTGYSPFYPDKMVSTEALYPIPIITNDWDIYGGYMILLHDIVDVYLDQVLDLVLDLPGFTFNNIEGNFQVLEKEGYMFLQEEINIDADVTISDITMMANNYLPPETLALDAEIILQESAWIAYASSGVLAGIRVQLDLDATISVDSVSFGTVAVDFDFKLRNPDYNPPDPIGTGIIPGFTWLVAIPALIGAAAVGLIIRRRK